MCGTACTQHTRKPSAVKRHPKRYTSLPANQGMCESMRVHQVHRRTPASAGPSPGQPAHCHSRTTRTRGRGPAPREARPPVGTPPLLVSSSAQAAIPEHHQVYTQGHCPVLWHGGFACLEQGEEVGAEHHVILHDDDVAVPFLQEHPVQAPLVVLRQPCMARLRVAQPLPSGQHGCRPCPYLQGSTKAATSASAHMLAAWGYLQHHVQSPHGADSVSWQCWAQTCPFPSRGMRRCCQCSKWRTAGA